MRRYRTLLLRTASLVITVGCQVISASVSEPQSRLARGEYLVGVLGGMILQRGT